MDLVQIRAKGSFGSGLLVRDGIILTSLHCIADPDRNWMDYNSIGAYLWRDLKGIEIAKPIERHLPLRVAWRPPPSSNPAIDMIVMQVITEPPPKPFSPALWCRTSTETYEGTARGFPALMDKQNILGSSGEINLGGSITFTSSTARSVLFNSRNCPTTTPQNAWSGLSGGPLMIGRAVIGVMRSVPGMWDQRETLEAEPLAPLLEDDRNEKLRSLLKVERPLPTIVDILSQQADLDEINTILSDFQRIWEQIQLGLHADDVVKGRDVKIEVRRKLERLIKVMQDSELRTTATKFGVQIKAAKALLRTLDEVPPTVFVGQNVKDYDDLFEFFEAILCCGRKAI